MKSLFSILLPGLFLIFSFTANSQINVSGKIVDDVTTTPIKSAHIEILTSEGLQFSTSSADDGSFAIDITNTRSYTLHVIKVGYHKYHEVITLDADQYTNTHSIRLLRAAASSNDRKSHIDISSMSLGAIAPHNSKRSSQIITNTMSSTTSTTAYIGTQTENQHSGQVTVGEWNDLHNWQDWIQLLSDPDYQIMTELHQLYPTERYAVFVTNQNQAPLANIKVTLSDANKNAIWTAITDNAGRVELWSGVDGAPVDADLTITIKGQDHNAVPISQGMNQITIDMPCSETSEMDIVFIVDATSSMSDEINYLKAEILDVIDRIRYQNTDVTYHLGSVFYRDHNDDYLTRISPLSEDAEILTAFIKKQKAAGGGDIPEALDAALQDVLDINWRQNSSKIAFLLLDAPPHDDDVTMTRIRAQIIEAAKKGIKLIPISASGIDRKTDFLMKFMAVLTNGTYVFITDDSGIGNAHLTPVVDNYDVEYLNDCLVRLITQYSQPYSCAAPRTNTTDTAIKIFPNPTADYITITSTSVPDHIQILSSNGMLIMEVHPKEQNTKINLSAFVNGICHVLVKHGDTITTEQIILLT